MGSCFNISTKENPRMSVIIPFNKEPRIENEDLNIVQPSNLFEKFKKFENKDTLETVLNILSKKKLLNIVKYNKSIKERLNINNNDYKEFDEIEIEVTPVKNKYGKFINMKKEEESYYHIYFNNNKEDEIKRNYLIENDKVTNINIIIDYNVKSFHKLFEWCECIESLNFKRFNRGDIVNMESMFYECTALKEINLSILNTRNVTNMYCMFWGCSSLKELKLSNFDTKNVITMKYMFYGCPDELKKEIKANFKNIGEEAFY